MMNRRYSNVVVEFVANFVFVTVNFCHALQFGYNYDIPTIMVFPLFSNKKGQLLLTNPRDACKTFARFM